MLFHASMNSILFSTLGINYLISFNIDISSGSVILFSGLGYFLCFMQKLFADISSAYICRKEFL